jgi:hypothetical protein
VGEAFYNLPDVRLLRKHLGVRMGIIMGMAVVPWVQFVVMFGPFAVGNKNRSGLSLKFLRNQVHTRLPGLVQA